jgi:hypothetical protein
MTYSVKTIHAVKNGNHSLGNKLGREAVSLDFSVIRVSKLTGATRQTVYNWFIGGEVIAPYRASVEKLLDILNNSSTADAAWTRACQEFNLQA